MMRLRSLFCLLLALVLLGTCGFAWAEEDEIVEDIWVDPDDELSETIEKATPVLETEEVFTPSHGSAYTDGQGSAYWNTPMDISDEEAVWNMLMEPITVVDLGKIKGKSKSQLTKVQTYLYQEPDEKSKIIGEVSNLS
ncbi:MAG: hypothetical protein VZQ29_12200, partial [Succiniclasticum sp.]|nr:hypothetical protein [Succiniclasticum sp.]